MIKKLFKVPVGVCLALIWFGDLSHAQTFNVISRTSLNDFFNTLDSSYIVRFNVSLSSPTALTNVVPTLTPPNCLDGSGLPVFNTTYQGFTGQTDPTNLVIPSWTNGQQRELIFLVHLYDQQGGAGSDYCSGVLCSDLDFNLQFSYTGQTSPVAALDPNDELSFQQPQDGFFVEDIHSITPSGPPACQSYSQAVFTIALQPQTFNHSLLSDPDIRVLMGVNWNIHLDQTVPPDDIPDLPFSNGIGIFLYPLSSSHIFDLVQQVSSQGLNMVDQNSRIVDEDGEQFTLGPLGGKGPAGLNCNYQSWNFFDITNRNVPGGQVKTVLNNLPVNSEIQAGIGVTLINFRRAGIFLARQGSCSTSTAFGDSPNDFQITALNLLPGSQATVSVQVPAAWKSGSQLTSAYQIQWFYRNHNTYKKATKPGGGATALRNLTETIALPYAAPANFAIEARIEHVSTGSVVSVVSPRHQFNYTGLASGGFSNAEASPDIYLDPGESYVIPATVQNQTGKTVQDVKIKLGVTGPAGIDVGLSGETAALTTYADPSGIVFSQASMPNSQLVDIDLIYQLLCMSQSCQDISGYMEFSFRDGAFNTSYRQNITVPGNCQFENQTISMDGSWTALECFGTPTPCQDSNCTNVDCSTNSPYGWAYANGDWTGFTQSIDFFYTLQSQSLNVGSAPSIHMNHDCDFDWRDAGGIVEYRTGPDGVNWSNWNDLIIPIEGQAGMEYYNSTTFLPGDIPANVDNIIGNRRVFMKDFLGASIVQDWTHSVPAGLFNQAKVQFRITFQQPQNDGITAGSWTVSDFDYISQFPVSDNLFKIPTGLMFSSCLDTIVLLPGVGGTFDYHWYSSLEDLATDNWDHYSTDGTWTGFPIPTTDATYFVKITNANGTSRIGKFTVQAESMVPPLSLVVEYWRAFSFPGTADINLDGQVDVLDVALQVNLDECN